MYDNKYDIGIDPMTLTTAELTASSVIYGDRRVGWIFKYWVSPYIIDISKHRKLCMLKIYPDINSPESINRINNLKGHFNIKKMVSSEVMIYHPDYFKQALAAKNELIRRGGYWTKDTPETDIYMARLMGYGESYIIDYIKEVHPDFKLNDYIKNNPRDIFLHNINNK